MTIPNCPLNDQQCLLANQVLQDCAQCREELHRMEQLGIPVDDARAAMEDHSAFFTRLKQLYFPDHP